MRFTSTKVQNGPNVTEVLTGSESKSVSATKMGTTDYHDAYPALNLGGFSAVGRRSASADLTGVDHGSNTNIGTFFDTSDFDIGGRWSSDRWNILPEDAGKIVRVGAKIENDAVSGGRFIATISHYGSDDVLIKDYKVVDTGSSAASGSDRESFGLETPPIQVSSGDYFTIGNRVLNDSSINVSASDSYTWLLVDHSNGNDWRGGELSEIVDEKMLSGNVTTDGVMADLTFPNLIIGEKYKYTLNPFLSYTDTNVAIKIYNGTTQLNRAAIGTDRAMYGLTGEFVATATTLTFEASSVGSDSINGDGTKNETWAQLIRYRQNDTVIGEAEYTDLSGGWVTMSATTPTVSNTLADLVRDGDYDDIEFEWYAARADGSSGAGSMTVEYNGDSTSSNYHHQQIFGDDGADTNSEGANNVIGVVASDTANHYAHNIITFSDYKSTDIYRQGETKVYGNIGATRLITGHRICVNQNQTAALTSLTWGCSGDFKAGTRYRVWGIKKGNKGGGMVIESQDQWPTVSNNAVDSDADIDISPGTKADSTASTFLRLSSSITKQLDAVFAAGTGAGGRASAVSLTADTMYHVFLIQKDDDGTVDAYFDTSIVAANIPTGYTKYSYQMSVLTDSSSDIVGFVHVPEKRTVFYKALQTVVDTTSPSTSDSNTESVPAPAGTLALFRQVILNSSVAGSSWQRVASVEIGNINPVLRAQVDSLGVDTDSEILVDDNSEVTVYAGTASNWTSFTVYCTGYKY